MKYIDVEGIVVFNSTCSCSRFNASPKPTQRKRFGHVVSNATPKRKNLVKETLAKKKQFKLFKLCPPS